MRLSRWVQEQVLENISHSTQRVVVAFSGGIDSTSLLHVCAQLQNEFPCPLLAIHINHGLSDNADQWQAHCESIANSYSVPFASYRVSVSNTGKGIEAAARDARFQQIMEVTSKHDLILLGQHDDDQVETFMIQLMRGSGLDGLVAMPALRESQHRTYHRPLLGVSRKDIEEYAEFHALHWVEDDSNLSTQFDRNYLRHEVLPRIKERFPNYVASVNRSIAHLQDYKNLMNDILEEKLASCLDNGRQLNISNLLTLNAKWHKPLLKEWIRFCGVAQPSSAVLQQIVMQGLEAVHDAEPCIQWENIQCRRYDGKLYLLPIYKSVKGRSFSLDLASPTVLPDDLGSAQCEWGIQTEAGFSVKKLEWPLEIRFTGYSAKFKPVGESMSKPVKQWFKKWKLAPWERERIPLFFSGDTLIQVGDVPDQNALAGATEKKRVVIRHRK